MKLADLKKLCDTVQKLPVATFDSGPESFNNIAFYIAARAAIPNLIAVAEAAMDAVDSALWIDANTLAFELEKTARARLKKALAALEADE